MIVGRVLIEFGGDDRAPVRVWSPNPPELARRVARLVAFRIENPSAVACAVGACREHHRPYHRA